MKCFNNLTIWSVPFVRQSPQNHKKNQVNPCLFRKTFVSLPLEHRLMVLMGLEDILIGTLKHNLGYLASVEARRCDFVGK